MLGWVSPVAGHFFNNLRNQIFSNFNFKKQFTLCLVNQNLKSLEPIGGAGPKFSSESKSLGTFEKTQNAVLALLCPAQGFPLPSFRYFEDASLTQNNSQANKHYRVETPDIQADSMLRMTIARKAKLNCRTDWKCGSKVSVDVRHFFFQVFGFNFHWIDLSCSGVSDACIQVFSRNKTFFLS